MPDIGTISAALSSLKAATDIVKFIRESDVSLERAELKLRLADLMGTLADAKIQLSDVQSHLAEKDCEIRRLNEALATRGDVVRYFDAMYFKDESGKASGVPYCIACWSDKHKLSPLAEDHADRSNHICTNCGRRYARRLTPRDATFAQRPATA